MHHLLGPGSFHTCYLSPFAPTRMFPETCESSQLKILTRSSFLHIFWQSPYIGSLSNYEHSECRGQMVWMNDWTCGFQPLHPPNSPYLLQEKTTRSHLNYPSERPKMWWRCASVFGILVSNVGFCSGKKWLANVFAGPQLINSSSSVLNKQVNPSTTYLIQYYWGFPISKHYIPSNTIVFFIEPKRTQLSIWHLFD